MDQMCHSSPVDAAVLQGPLPSSLNKMGGTKILSSLFYVLIDYSTPVADPELELRGCFACPDGFSSFCDFFSLYPKWSQLR